MDNLDLSWLPNKILEKAYNNNLDFISAVEEAFKNDFVRNITYFNSIRIGIKKYPIESSGESSTFWHITTSTSRNIDGKEIRKRCPMRCERIKWPKAIFENDSDLIKVWRENNPGKKRIIFYFQLSIAIPKEQDYIVILDDRKTYFLLWTTYCFNNQIKSNSFIKRYNTAKKAGDALI